MSEKDFDERLEELFPTICGTGAFRAGCWCPKGWEKLVVEALKPVEQYASASLPSLRVDQIKEKFGGLRIYVSHHDEVVSTRLDWAETKSRTVCEKCGAPGGEVKVRGWMHTFCATCAGEGG